MIDNLIDRFDNMINSPRLLDISAVDLCCDILQLVKTQAELIKELENRGK